MAVLDYSYLKQQVEISAVSAHKYTRVLAKLKEHYKDVIDSKRRYEDITTFGQLFDVLEIRAVLAEDKLEPLKEIAESLSNKTHILKLIADFEGRDVTKNCGHYYEKCHVHFTKNKEPAQSYLKHFSGTKLSDNKRKRIIDTIVKEIGSFWRDLGRNLKIREGEIDKIDKNPNYRLPQKASELMNIYEFEKANPDKWFFDLCEALEKSRRKELSIILHEIMNMNI